MDPYVALNNYQDNSNCVVPVGFTTRPSSEHIPVTSTSDDTPTNNSLLNDLFQNINNQPCQWEAPNSYLQEPLPEHPTLWIANELPLPNIDESSNSVPPIPLYMPAELPAVSISSPLQEEGHVSPFPDFNPTPLCTDSFLSLWDSSLGHHDANEDQHFHITTDVTQYSPGAHVNHYQQYVDVDDGYGKWLESLSFDQLLAHFLGDIPMYTQPHKPTAYTQVDSQEPFINHPISTVYEEGIDTSLDSLPILSNEAVEAQVKLIVAHLQPASMPATELVAGIPTTVPTEGTSLQAPSPAKTPSVVGSSPSLSDTAAPPQVNGSALPWAVPSTDAPFIFQGNTDGRATKQERECPWCFKKFVTTQSVATRHMNSCQSNPNRVLWQCDICGKQYCRVDVRTTHMQKQHPREYQLMKQSKPFQRYAQAWAEVYL